MPIELIPVLGSGLVAGVAMLALQVAARAAKPPGGFDAAAFWAGLLALRGASAWTGGLVIHFLVSVGVAAGYALGFSVARVTDMGWAWGLVGATIHWVIAGAFVAVVPANGESATAPTPGPFGRRLGPNGALAFLAAHLVFGLVTGLVYFLLNSAGGVSAAL